MPSVVAKTLLDEAQHWLEAVAACVESYTYPRGPIIAWVGDGICSAPAPGGGGLLDRSEAGLEFFSRFLKVKYAALKVPVGTTPVDGPVRPSDLERCIAWVEAGELAHRSQIVRQVSARPALAPARPASGTAACR